MPKKLFKTGWQYLTSPQQAAKSCKKSGVDADCLWLYAIATFAFMVVFWLKPFDFPDPNVPVPTELQDFAFWLRAEAWQPVLEFGWIVFLLGFLRFYQKGSWPVRLAASVLWTAAPFILIVLYAQIHAFPKWGFALGCLAWVGSFYPVLKKTGRADWWPLINFSAGVNAVAIPIVLALAVSVWTRTPELFKAGQIAGGLWLLGATTVGVRELSGLRLPRAFMAVILSAFLQFALTFCLHFLGAHGVLKALYYG